MNDIEHEEFSDDVKIEITDLDSDKVKSVTALKFSGQRFLSRRQLWMTLLTIIGMLILCVLLLSPFRARLASRSTNVPVLAEKSCSQSVRSLVVLVVGHKGSQIWFKRNASAGGSQNDVIYLFSDGTGQLHNGNGTWQASPSISATVICTN